MLSGYRAMWLLVMFDLPVTQKDERKEAAEFRNYLLDLGFEMAQFSVYMRFFASAKQIETCCQRICAALPKGGKVNIMQFTDKQYEKIISFYGQVRQPEKSSPDQFELF